MSKPAGIDLSQGAESLGVLAVRGADAAKFLQGQLSADVERLAVGASTFAGLHNPQGRVIALLALVRAKNDEILAVLPRELIAPCVERLRKYVFRAKIRLEDASAAYDLIGVRHDAPAPADIANLAWGSRRVWLPTRERAVESNLDATALADWHRADIADGLPQVYAATTEAFVAQMLNLDLLGAIAFDKGCYTGQEVIARAHYRGRVKRRAQRWETAAILAPGDSARAPDGRAVTVVRVAPTSSGQELLAVGAFAPLVDSDTPTSRDNATLAGVWGPLPLPYSLPE